LIDADMRRPRLHTLFDQNQEPGLSNLLTGHAKASAAVFKSCIPGLWLMPSGALPPNPADLLGSHRFKDFIATLADHFDWVLVDTPPVMAVTDAALVAHCTTGVLFVVGCEMTNRNTAAQAIEHGRAARKLIHSPLGK
jgi:receptor protein-tyrosine kinase